MRSKTAVRGALTEATAMKESSRARFRSATPVLWAWLDLNQRPHPYQVSRAQRCADRHSPKSLASVRAKGCVLSGLVPSSAGKPCRQWIPQHDWSQIIAVRPKSKLSHLGSTCLRGTITIGRGRLARSLLGKDEQHR
jgi:hypothetical protein